MCSHLTNNPPWPGSATGPACYRLCLREFVAWLSMGTGVERATVGAFDSLCNAEESSHADPECEMARVLCRGETFI